MLTVNNDSIINYFTLADQDPEFRRVFYRELLPELRRRGKAVVAITHDDRYFDVADRIITLAEGRVRDVADFSLPASPAVSVQ